MDPGSLVRLEISKGWGQVQNLHNKIKLIASLEGESSSSSCLLHIQDRAALVDETARIISTFTNVIAYLNQQVTAPTPPPPASESSQSDEDRSPKKRKSSNVRQQNSQQNHHQQQQAEIIPDDGHSWRKYGQKDILGSRHPKSYYRCTHKRESGCPAIKYVQRSDSDPASFHITYKGEHTCQSFQTPGSSRSQQAKPLQQLPFNSACLRINSDGALQITPSGPTLTPSTSFSSPNLTTSASFSSPTLTPAASFNSDTKVTTPVYQKPEQEQQQQQQELTPQTTGEVVAEHSPLSMFDLSFFLDNSPDCLDLSFHFEQPSTTSST